MRIDARANFKEVAGELRTFNKEVVERSTKVIRAKVALDVFSGVIKRSPVDTGRFRANWFISVGSVPTDQYDENAGGTSKRPKSAKGAKGRGADMAVSLMDVDLGETVWITNNTPYGIVLEAGHSDQAPKGVVLVTALAVVERAKRSLARGGGA